MSSQDILNIVQSIAILILLTFFIYLFLKINKTLSDATSWVKILEGFMLKSNQWIEKFRKFKKNI